MPNCGFRILSFSLDRLSWLRPPRTAGRKRPRPPTYLDLEPAAIAGAVATVGTLAWWLGGADERAKKANYAEWEAIEKERERLAYIEPREVWREEELAELLGIPHKIYMQVGLFPIAYTIGTDFKPAHREPLEKVLGWNGFPMVSSIPASMQRS